jgi:hypothetical protein
MLAAMKPLIDAFWRAAFYCIHPRIVVLSLLPLVLVVILTAGVGYFFWDAALAAV